MAAIQCERVGFGLCHFQKWAAQAPAWRGGFAGKF